MQQGSYQIHERRYPVFLSHPFDEGESWISTGMAIDLPDAREQRLIQAVADSHDLALVKKFSSDGIYFRLTGNYIGSKERLEIYRRRSRRGAGEADSLRDCLVSWRG